MQTNFMPLRRAARSLGLLTVGVLSTLGALSLSHVGPVQAQTPGVNLAQLVAQVNTLQSTVTNQGNTITSQGSTISTLKSQQATDEQTITSQGNSITSLQSTVSSQAQTISSLKSQEQSDIQNTQKREQNDIQNVQNQEKSDFTNLNGSVVALQAKTAPLSVSSDPNVGGTNTLLTIKGVNVQIVSGSGYTDDGTNSETQNTVLSGLGNLIIGYNAPGHYDMNGLPTPDLHTGSHNLILGDQNNYTSYGGLIAGEDNAISDLYASVSGGTGNTAAGQYSSVSGGEGNTASNYACSVSGGAGNTASNIDASVSGGYKITQNKSAGWSGGSYHSP